MTEAIIVAVISGLCSLCGVYFSNRKSSALIEYRLEKLEEKVNLHNSVIERTYRLEEAKAVMDEKINAANSRIADLESR